MPTVATPTVAATATPVSTAGITTASFTPAANSLLIAVGFNTGSSGANGLGSIGSSHGGAGALTWQGGVVLGGGNSTGALRYWWAVAPSSPTAGTVTINCPGTPTIQNARVLQIASGFKASAPLALAGGVTGTTATSLTANLTAAPTVDDLQLVFAINRNKATAPSLPSGSPFTLRDSAASATPSASFLIAYRSGSTSTGATVENLGTTWSAVHAVAVKADDAVVSVDEWYLWDGVSLATSPRLDPFEWDGATLQPLDVL